MTEPSTANDQAGVVFLPPVGLLITLVLAAILDWLVPVGFARNAITATIGTVVCLFACLVALWAVVIMYRAKTAIEPHGATTTIISRGPFAFSRNPIYVGMVLILVGFALILGSWWYVVAGAGFVWAMVWGVITREERYLEGKFGEEYLAYKARVRRWL